MHHSDNLTTLMIAILIVVYAFGVLFIACELGQRISLAFVECSQMIDQFKWYAFPAKVQRMLPMILKFNQQPFEIKCFGNMKCNRDTFKYVRTIGKSIPFL